MTDTVVEPDTTTALSTQPKAPSRPGGRGPIPGLRQAWRRLTSMRTALLLLTLLALAAIPGTVFPQRNLAPNKVSTYLTDHPSAGRLMDKLGLFNVFSSPWFAAIYLLLFVSLVGCLIPRIRLHARAMMKRPPNAPRSLMRMPASTQWNSDETPQEVAERVHRLLRRSRWRSDVRAEPDGVVTVAAEKGYLRETGNLIFHVALVTMLVGIALSALFGYKGTILVSEGGGFANARESYAQFFGSKFFSDSELSPFQFTLTKFSATFQPNAEPKSFDAYTMYKATPSSPAVPYDIRVNHPLNAPGAKVFLEDHGYSLRISVTNHAGKEIYNGDVPFLPEETTPVSTGVLKIPDLDPYDGKPPTPSQQLGLTGSFYSTAAHVNGTSQLTSAFPAADNPLLVISGFKGDLGFSTGAPQPDFSLDVSHLHQMGLDHQLAPGQSVTLPDGATVRFEKVDEWAEFQVAHEPGKTTVLLAAILIVAGLLGSLRVRRRRFWIRAIPAPDGDGQRRTVVTAAGLARSDTGGFVQELDDLVGRIGRPQAGTPATERD